MERILLHNILCSGRHCIDCVSAPCWVSIAIHHSMCICCWMIKYVIIDISTVMSLYVLSTRGMQCVYHKGSMFILYGLCYEPCQCVVLLCILGPASKHLNIQGFVARDSINDRIESSVAVQCWFDDMRQLFLSGPWWSKRPCPWIIMAKRSAQTEIQLFVQPLLVRACLLETIS